MTNEAVAASVDFLDELSIKLDKNDAVFLPGETLRGRVVIVLKGGEMEMTQIRLVLSGTGRLRHKGMKKDDNETKAEELVLLKREVFLVDKSTRLPEGTTVLAFEETLPFNLPTAIDCKFGRILYMARVSVGYRKGTETAHANAAQGLTIVERTDLNLCSPSHFEPVPLSSQRTFGLCSCIGGQMRCVLTVEKTAFVCGESLSITGRIENKSDKRIEKVSVTIQQKLTKCIADFRPQTTEGTREDTTDIHEDSLALFVDAGACIKIDRKLHIPPLPPSTPIESEMSGQHPHVPRRARMSLTGSRISHGSGKITEKSTGSNVVRPFTVSYSLAFRVRSSGDDVMEMFVPVIVGSLPLHSTKTDAYNEKIVAGEDPATYKQCKNDKLIKLLSEKDRGPCNKGHLQFVNRYPVYVDLTTSSKQSKKISMLASAIRAEGRLMQGARERNERLGTIDSGGTDTAMSSVTELSFARSAYTNSDFVDDDDEKIGPVVSKTIVIEHP